MLIIFAASQLGLSGVPRQIQQAINLVPNTVNSALRTVVGRIASAVGLNPSNGGEMFRKFCAALGVPEIPEMPQFSDLRSRAENRGALNVLIAERTRTRTVAEWITILNDAGVPCGPILSVSEMWEDEQVRHLELAQTVAHPDLDTVSLVGQPLN